MDFKKEFNRIVGVIDSKQPICFVRYGDGEVMIMNNSPVPQSTQAYSIDKWSSNGGKTKLGDKLIEVLNHKEKEWIYGIPCKCCNNTCKNHLLSKLDLPINQITYANLFVNSNYNLFLEWIKKLDEEVILITNESVKNNLTRYPFKVKDYFPIKDDCLNYYEKNDLIFTENLKETFKNTENTLFLISAGPLSELIIHELWSINKTNRLIDVGSSLDFYTHNKITRPYMVTGNYYNLKKCDF